jgi:hypothetical protein
VEDPSQLPRPAMQHCSQLQSALPHLARVGGLHAVAKQGGEHPVWQLSAADLRGGGVRRGGRRDSSAWHQRGTARLAAKLEASLSRPSCQEVQGAEGARWDRGSLLPAALSPPLTTVERHSTLCWLMGSSATAAAYTAAAAGACRVRASSTCK